MHNISIHKINLPNWVEGIFSKPICKIVTCPFACKKHFFLLVWRNTFLFFNGVYSISIILLKKCVIHAEETEIGSSPFKMKWLVSILWIRFKVGPSNSLHDVNVGMSY
jgi:hypothetical protein